MHGQQCDRAGGERLRMTIHGTCLGCVRDKHPCAYRDSLSVKLHGLGLTSIKFRCRARELKFQPGDPVWAFTSVSYGTSDEEGQPYKDDFAAVFINGLGAKGLVWIEPGTPGRELGEDGIKFEPNGSGFCKIPLSRLTPRDGEREEVCRSCMWPASKGHLEGYSCAFHPGTAP